MSQLDLSPKLALVIIILVLFLAVGMITACLIVVVDTRFPDPPVMKNDIQQKDLQQDIEEQIKNYKEVSEVIRANKANTLELIVTTTFLPIFQALIVSTLAFIFGKVLIDLIAEYIKSRNRRSQ